MSSVLICSSMFRKQRRNKVSQNIDPNSLPFIGGVAFLLQHKVSARLFPSVGIYRIDKEITLKVRKRTTSRGGPIA